MLRPMVAKLPVNVLGNSGFGFVSFDMPFKIWFTQLQPGER